ncbi:hypothetical protein LQZ18_15530 [Lachnospiraceae bacterium ZAX-1]
MFPKMQMKMSELEPLGFSKLELRKYFNRPNQNFARKKNPLKENSVIVFNTILFEEFLKKEIEWQNRARRRDFVSRK